jgi:hypothetical protein
MPLTPVPLTLSNTPPCTTTPTLNDPGTVCKTAAGNGVFLKLTCQTQDGVAASGCKDGIKGTADPVYFGVAKVGNPLDLGKTLQVHKSTSSNGGADTGSIYGTAAAPSAMQNNQYEWKCQTCTAPTDDHVWVASWAAKSS